MGIINHARMSNIAESIVDYMGGTGGVSVAYGDFKPDGGSNRVGNKMLSILHTRKAITENNQAIEDTLTRARQVCSDLSAEDIKFELSRIPTFALSIEDCRGYRGAIVFTIYATQEVDYSWCLARAMNKITEFCRAENRTNDKLVLGHYRIYGGFVDENGLESIYFEMPHADEVKRRIADDFKSLVTVK